jgi:hypothetical protein
VNMLYINALSSTSYGFIFKRTVVKGSGTLC